MSIIKKIITFRPGYTARIITGVVSVLVFLSACAIVGLGDLTRALGQQDAKYNARAIEEGAKVYFDQCARCHGLDGKGIEGQGPAMNSLTFLGRVEGDREVEKSQRLADIEWIGSLDSYIRAVTAAGIPLKSSNVWDVVHPPFGMAYAGNLRDDQIANVSKFILNWRQNPATTDVIEQPKPGEAFGPRPTAVPMTPEQEAGLAVFQAQGCGACHAIKGVANGAVGPNLNKIATEAEAIVTADDYKSSAGVATNAKEYIQESIVNPNAYIYPKCPQGACLANLMPPNYGETIPADGLNSLVEYLLSLK